MFWLLVLALLNVAYVAALPAASLFYVANVLLHLVLGFAAAAWLCFTWRRSPKVIPLAIAALAGIYLIARGATSEHRAALWIHIAFGVIGLLILVPKARTLLVTLSLIAMTFRFGRPNTDRIQNPNVPPASMAEEGAGPKSPFWPSSAKTNTGGLIPSDFFMDSKTCAECHKDIYDQWNGSMHHWASFNNRFYRASILHMQELSGTQGSKWCAACHDHAVFFNGRFEKPIKDQLETPEAQNGLGCVSCHSMVHVDSSMGNSGFTMMYPPLHRLASSQNPLIRKAGDFLTYLNPEPHKLTFMKPYMRNQTSEYCSTCHKVHLDEPVNHYRWIRGFNEYDNWQASGVSGQGARSFYYPPKSQGCADCHMPMVKSNDAGSKDGMIHSHRFPGANTAVPFVNNDAVQLAEEEKFLQSGFMTVDLFAVSPVEEKKAEVKRAGGDAAPVSQSMFGVGEESDQNAPVTIRDVGKVMAPLNAPGVALQPGSTVRVDAVVRTKKIGHFFPAGTVDGYDVWLEFQARDAKGRILAWSGRVDDDGKGPVEKGAHFYKSFQLDGEGNPINKRNAWQTRSVLYVRLIPPGADDTVHFRVSIPKDAVGPVTLEAKLNYRKFSNYFTKFAYAGVPKSGNAGIAFDSREYSFDSAPVPNIPIVVIASAKTQIALGEPKWSPVVRKQDRERWNDWGIGLLLQGDLKGAEYAFTRVIEADASYADGWLNVGRALIQEGETERARSYVMKALQLQPKLARGEFFLSQIQKAAGDYDASLRSLSDCAEQYPRDRVVLNQMGRVYFLQRKYSEAARAFQRTLSVDAEDVQAHYNLMLCYRGLRQNELAEREQKLFLRFKADESSQALTAKPRLLNPEDNNERQQIHDHISTYDSRPERVGAGPGSHAGR